MMHYFYLTVAILSEVVATSFLKAAGEFTRFIPSVIVVVGYLSAFYFLMLSMRTIPLGIAYAMWSGIGMTLIPIAGFFLYKQSLDIAAIVGMALIIAGVVIIQFFSKVTG